jgi:hypothetical protein
MGRHRGLCASGLGAAWFRSRHVDLGSGVPQALVENPSSPTACSGTCVLERAICTRQDRAGLRHMGSVQCADRTRGPVPRGGSGLSRSRSHACEDSPAAAHRRPKHDRHERTPPFRDRRMSHNVQLAVLTSVPVIFGRCEHLTYPAECAKVRQTPVTPARDSHFPVAGIEESYAQPERAPPSQPFATRPAPHPGARPCPPDRDPCHRSRGGRRPDSLAESHPRTCACWRTSRRQFDHGRRRG